MGHSEEKDLVDRKKKKTGRKRDTHNFVGGKEKGRKSFLRFQKRGPINHIGKSESRPFSDRLLKNTPSCLGGAKN